MIQQGVLIEELIRLALTISIILQSAVCWRLRAQSRSAFIAGWVTLSVWALAVAVDTLHDAGVLLTLLTH